MRSETVVEARPRRPSPEHELKARFQVHIEKFEEASERGKGIPFRIEQVGRLRGIRLHAGTFRKDLFSQQPTTIQVNLRRVVLRLEIVGEPGKRERYYPVGIAFERADETCPIGRIWTTAPQCLPGSPFCALRFNDPPRTIEITDIVTKVRDDNAKFACGTHRTYRFTVFVQDSLTGRIGMIDPEIENENQS